MSFLFKLLQTATKLRYLALTATGLGLYNIKSNLDNISDNYRKYSSYLENFSGFLNLFNDDDMSFENLEYISIKELNIPFTKVHSLSFNKNSKSNKSHKPLENDVENDEINVEDKEEKMLKLKLKDTIEEMIEIQRKFQTQIDSLEKENKSLRKQLSETLTSSSSLKYDKTLIEMYSEILDILSEYDNSYSIKDTLPRIVVVGDQSSGKTSLLEMLCKVRIFPRGSGEMMTRCPVMVTLSEGPLHVASFKGSPITYDLTKETDIVKVREEIESRMKSFVDQNKTVSEQVISLYIKGPDLQRMVLVDLPGIINTVTSEMSPNTKNSIMEICQSYLSNPNSIILCVHDGSVDAERSLVTDLVSRCDPTGQRTICVLTKIDLAEKNQLNQDRLKKLLSGRLFPMKAIEYFGVVTGTGDIDESISKIKNYEEDFFKRSNYLRNGIMRPSQVTVHNLSYAISKCFWKMVLRSVNEELEKISSRHYALSVEWRNNFPGLKELTRDELFERARNEITDDLVSFSNISSSNWENLIFDLLSTKFSPFVFTDILLKNMSISSNDRSFKTNIDVALKKWLETTLSDESVKVAKQIMLEQLDGIFEDSKDSHSDSYRHLLQPIKNYVVELCKQNYEWCEAYKRNLNVIQKCALDDNTLPDQNNWDVSAVFFQDIVLGDNAKVEERMIELIGPSRWDRIFKWQYVSSKQATMRKIKEEVDKILLSKDLDDMNNESISPLDRDEMESIWRSLQSKGVAADKEDIATVINLINQHKIFSDVLDGIQFCRRNYNRKNEIQKHKVECNDIVLFWRFYRMLQLTANSLRQEIINTEIRRLENNIKSQLDNLSSSEIMKKKLIVGDEIDLAEEIRKISLVKEYLENFTKALDKDKVHKLF